MRGNVIFQGLCKAIIGWLFALTVSAGQVQAAPKDQIPSINLVPYSNLVAKNCAKEPLTLEAIFAQSGEKLVKYQSPTSGGYSFGYTLCEHWFEVNLSEVDLAEGRWWLEVYPTFLDKVSLHVRASDGTWHSETTGDHVVQSARPISSRHLMIPVDVTSDTARYFLQVRTTSTLTLGLTLWQPDAFVSASTRENLFYGILFGLTITAIVICVMGGAWFRQYFYLVVGLFLFFNSFTHFTLNGFDHFLLFPESGVWSDRMMGFGVYGAGASGILLYLVFLQPYRYFPWLTRFCGIWIALASLGAIMSLFGDPRPSLAAMGSLVTMSLALILPLVMLRHRRQAALIMLAIFLPQWTSLMVQLARNFSLLPMVFWTTHIWAITSMLLVPFVSVVVMMRLRAQEQAYLEETEKARLHRDLFNMVAHELRTPLAVVSGALANIELQTLPQNSALAPRFSRANLSLARLNSLIDTALLEDRLLDEGISLQQKWIAVDELINQVGELRIIEAPHQLRICLPETSLQIYVDSYWLSMALLNLLDNAIKYSPEGGVICLSAAETAQGVELSISDQGIGIPPESKDQLFEKFYRADNARALRSVSGLGLGLFLVKRIVALHGGSLAHQDNRGGGSIFTCYLPHRAPD